VSDKLDEVSSILRKIRQVKVRLKGIRDYSNENGDLIEELKDDINGVLDEIYDHISQSDID